MARSHLSKSSLLVVSTAALLLAGCPDPQGEYDDFLDRTEGERGESTVTCEVTTPYDVNGEFLLNITTPLGATLPLNFVTATTIDIGTGDCAGGCTMTMNAQPIVPIVRSDTAVRTHANAGCPEPGTPVGDLIVVENIEVDAEGRFVADFGTQVVTGCANPISGGLIEATIVLRGNTISGDIYAGAVTGSVTSPVKSPLAGSTFAALRIDEGQPLCEVVALDCQDAIEGAGKCPGAGGSGGSGGTGGSGGSGGGN